MSFVYDQDDGAVGDIALTKEVGKLINDAARAVLKNARDGADIPGSKRKKFRRRSLRLWNSRVRTVDGAQTQAAFVTSYDNLAVIFEFGGMWTPPYRILTNAAKAAGLDYVETAAPGSFNIANIAGSDPTLELSGDYESRVVEPKS